MYKTCLKAIENKLSLLSKETRVMLALPLGVLIILFTHYGSKTTKADVLFAEMIHTVSDTIVIGLLFISLVSSGWILKALGKISGLLLCLAGSVAFLKAYTTLVETIVTQHNHVERKGVLLAVSLSTILLIAIQIVLIWNEHVDEAKSEEDVESQQASTQIDSDHIHGESSGHTHVRHVHNATRTELLADITQAFAGLCEYLVMLTVPQAPLFVRFVDLALTLGLGWWMIKRGSMILIGKNVHHH